MMSSRMSLNGMGLFEGNPEEKTSPFVMFNRVQAVPGKTPPAWGRRRQQTLRAKVVSGDRIQFVPVGVPGVRVGSQKFKAMGKKPLPGDFPGSILPYNRAGWAFVEPHPSAQGLGAEEEKSSWSAITDFIKTAAEKGKEFAPAIKVIRELMKKPKPAAPTYAAPIYQPPPTPPTNYLPYILIGGGVLLVGGLVTVLVLKG